MDETKRAAAAEKILRGDWPAFVAGFVQYLTADETRPLPDFSDHGIPAKSTSRQFIFEFPNGYGASVVLSPFSYGGPAGHWEVAVLGPGGNLLYGHPATGGDVEGHCSDARVAQVLGEIFESVRDAHRPELEIGRPTLNWRRDEE